MPKIRIIYESGEPERVIDFHFMGRRRPELHAALSAFARESGRFYLFDSVQFSPRVADAAEHRRRLADLVQRSRAFVVDVANADALDKTGGQVEFGPRYVEGAAGGAVLVGRAPATAAFAAQFGWPDAVLPLDENPATIRALVRALDEDPARCERIIMIQHGKLKYDGRKGVIAGLRLKLTQEEQEKIEKPLTTNPEAYEFYLRGRDVLFQYISHSFDDRDLGTAVKMFQEAIRLDPLFARAHYGLGRCYVHYGQGYGGQHYFHLAEEALQRALELDPDIPGAHLQMVYVYLYRGEKNKALATLADARREAPSDPTVFIIAGMLYRLNGLYDKALKQYDRLLELNPRDVVIASYNRGRLYTYRHEYEKAIAEFEKARAVEPEHPLVKAFLAMTYFNQDRIEECQTLLEEVLRDHPHFDAVQVPLAWCYSRRGWHDEARALITDRVKEVAAADHDVAVWLASLYAMENMRDEAIDWIRQAIKLGNENYPLYADNSRLDNLRCDLRFVDLMNELKQHWEERRK